MIAGDNAESSTPASIREKPIPTPLSTAPLLVKKISRAGLLVSLSSRETANTLRGKVFLEGEAPAPQEASVDPVCSQWLGPTVKSQAYVVGKNGELKDVVVVVDVLGRIDSWSIAKEPKAIRSEKCQFEPYVSAMQVGQFLRVENSDPHMHNVHFMGQPGINGRNYALFAGAPPVNFIPEPSKELRTGDYVPFLTIKCDVHPWMFAFVTIVPHPFFDVTDAEGSFEIKGLPEGVYRVTAHHRRAGKVEMQVEIGATGGELEFRIPLKK